MPGWLKIDRSECRKAECRWRTNLQVHFDIYKERLCIYNLGLRNTKQADKASCLWSLWTSIHPIIQFASFFADVIEKLEKLDTIWSYKPYNLGGNAVQHFKSSFCCLFCFCLRAFSKMFPIANHQIFFKKSKTGNTGSLLEKSHPRSVMNIWGPHPSFCAFK